MKDISEIGLCCSLPARVEEMTLVAIDLSLPGQPGPHRVQGAVVRCIPARHDKGDYEVAIYFTDVSQAARAALKAYVSRAQPV